MAYFLKKTNRKNGTYLQIYESFHDPEKKTTRHKSVKNLGYVSKLEENGISDPISYYSKEVEEMNKKRKAEKKEDEARLIGEDPIKNAGYFLAKGVMNKLKIENQLVPYKMVRDFKFDIYRMLESLVYSRIVSPASKLKSWNEIIPSLYENYSFSLDQVYEACEFFGEEYERFVEILNHQIKAVYGRKTGKVYFDCTNYYFEIDYEFEDKQKGPSKENRHCPIIGMALMLDENQIPLGMKMYPGNKSEKPYLRDMIKDLKQRNNITGKTIQVADKGLNCSDNIVEALKNYDGYIFSKSVKTLPAIEKEWVLLKNNGQWKEVLDSNGELQYKYKECVDDFEYTVFDEKTKKKKKLKIPEKRVLTYNPSLAKKNTLEIQKMVDKAIGLTNSYAKKSDFGEASKYFNFTSFDKKTGEVSDDQYVTAVLNDEKVREDLSLAGYNLLVTSELNMAPTEIYAVYHNLWKIEESFRILKGQLNARPVYLENKYSIYGHFLICYYSVTILRLLQYVEFNNELRCNDIVDFIRSFRFLIDKKTAINIAPMKKVAPVNDRLNLFNLSRYYFSDKDFKSLLKFAFEHQN